MARTRSSSLILATAALLAKGLLAASPEDAILRSGVPWFDTVSERVTGEAQQQ